MVQDAEVAYKIWGYDIAALKGKMMRKTPSSVILDIVWIPKEIRELHQNVTLSVDIFFFNSIPFFITQQKYPIYNSYTSH